MLGPGISNFKKIDNLATRVNLLSTFATLIPNAGPRVLQNGPWEGVIYLKFSEVSFWEKRKANLCGNSLAFCHIMR